MLPHKIQLKQEFKEECALCCSKYCINPLSLKFAAKTNGFLEKILLGRGLNCLLTSVRFSTYYWVYKYIHRFFFQNLNVYLTKTYTIILLKIFYKNFHLLIVRRYQLCSKNNCFRTVFTKQLHNVGLNPFIYI